MKHLSNRKIAEEQTSAQCIKNDIGLSDTRISDLCQGRRGGVFMLVPTSEIGLT